MLKVSKIIIKKLTWFKVKVATDWSLIGFQSVAFVIIVDEMTTTKL